MENTEKWDEAESIQLIRTMIESTKYKIYSDRFIYLLWGYSVLGCALIHYLLEFVIGFQNPSLVWLAMPLVSVVHFIFINKRLMEIVCLRLISHCVGLPLRVIRYKNNSRTRKGKRKTVANKKKATK